MAVDRDLGVAFVRALDRPIGAGWETTASTGVRGLRLLRESSAFASFLFTEVNPRSFEVLRANVAGEPRARAVLGDSADTDPAATFDYVDVDPYGSPLRFVDRALAATRPGGILAVTATDLPVLAGAQPSACRRLYGAEPVRGRLGPEGALRILLGVLAHRARGGGRQIRPLLAYVGGHHVRAYVALDPLTADGDPVGAINPGRWDGPPLPGTLRIGPLWTGPLVAPELAARLTVPPSAARPRELERFLLRLRDDAQIVQPFYYEANLLAGRLGLRRPPPIVDLLAELRRLGYRAGRTHVRPEGLRTDAPRSAVESAARALATHGDQSQKARVRA
jgi:tRNA (guanine26-N2/guanine27-N2)-dimethyltransferase